MTKRVTDKTLRRLGACADQVDQVELFRRTFPDGANPTRKNLLLAASVGLSLDWYASKALSAPLRAEYYRQIALLLAEYDKQAALLRVEHDKQIAPLRAAYDQQAALLWAEYEKQTAPLLWGLFRRGT